MLQNSPNRFFVTPVFQTFRYFITNERATRVDIHSILVLGPSALGRGENNSENRNLRNLRYIKNICHIILTLITSESAHPIIQVEQLKQRFWHNSKICLLFSHKQQQIFTTYC